MIERVMALLPRRKGAAPIVPERSVAGRTLLLMITIMSFLSAVTLGGVCWYKNRQLPGPLTSGAK